MRGAAHATAMQLASKMYSTYALERYVMRKLKGVTGVEILEWNGEEVKF